MKVLIIGSGAMGSLFAGKLKQYGINVSLFNRFNEHVKAIQQNGITIIDKDEKSVTTKVSVITNPNDLNDDFDLILVLVKTFATETVLEQIIPKLQHQPPILTLQNGIGNVEKIQKIAPDHDLFVGVTYAGASIEKPGVVLHRAWGKTILGSDSPEKVNDILYQIAETFSKSELETEVSDHVQSIIWNKLFTNIAYNGLTAITRLKNGDPIRMNEGKEIVTKLIEEAVHVAKIKGIHHLHPDPASECIRLGEEEIGMNTSSMLSDVLHQRKTEIDAINGAIVEEGKKYGIPTPYNDMIVNLIKIIESNYTRMVK